MTTIDLELASPPPTVGAPLHGRVHVRGEVPADGAVRVAAVVTLRDLTSPQGFARTHEECATSVEVAGAEVAFALPRLNGPPSYRGSRVELSWSVVATLRRGASVLAKAEVPLAVGEGGAGEPSEPLDYRGHVLPRDAYQPSFGQHHREGPGRPPLPVPPTAVAIQRALDWLARVVFPRHFTMELSVNPTRVRRGEDVEVGVTLDVREPTIVEGITAWTVEFEGQTAHLAPYAKEIEDQLSRHKLCERARLEPGSHHYTTRIAVPPDAAPSYTAGFLCIARLVRVAVQVDGKPELVRDWHLAVH